MLVGLTGKARTGKDTVGLYLSQCYEFHVYSFAKPLKRAAQEMFGLSDEQCYDDALKEVVIKEWGYSPRQMFQMLGTEGGRELFREDIWVQRAKIELYNYRDHLAQERAIFEYDAKERMVITDVRFDNEADWIRSEGGTIWHIKRDDAAQVSAHKSEGGVKFVEGIDKVIDNNKGMEWLYEQVDKLIK